MPYLTAHEVDSVFVRVYVQPRASRNAICGIHDGSLKVAITTPPVDGKANQAVIKFLAKTVATPKRDVALYSGKTSRRKVFLITGRTLEEIRGYIEPILKS